MNRARNASTATHSVRFAITVVAAIAASSCVAPPDPAEDPGPPPVPRARILVNERPHDPASVEVELPEVRYGDPLHVLLDGLPPGELVVLDSSGGAGTSRARFLVPEDGVVELARDAPESGDWQGADAEAFITQMRDPPGGALDLDLSVVVSRDADEDGEPDEELARASVHRRYIDEGLVVEEVHSGRTVGALALPPGEGPFPAVLVFGGSEGGTGTGVFHAMYLASLGYAALGVGYFDAAGLPSGLTDVPLEILEEDLAFLTADPRIDPERVVVMGGSRGGELALLVGVHFPVVAGVIAEVPSGLVWGSGSDATGAAWTLDGAPLPYVPASDVEPEVEVDDAGAAHWRMRGMFLADMERAAAEALAAATIPAEEISGPVLFLSGDDDQLWPSCVLAEVAVARRRRSDDVVLCHPEAGHASVGVPGWSTVDSVESFHPALDGYLVLGGTAQGNGRALRANDTAVRAFLEAVLAD
ncbi:MAG: acyl-CoA thioesterase/BAAT N-terminal domain-containing protein [Deltaproteobacteria bacterium]|nr:acyl-CoA thioesterase/BAAT N-terminal domain-containing protein [Deltaproteobacteria bacterium]